MNFQALLVTRDDGAIAPLKQVLSGFGLSVQTCHHSAALGRLRAQKFDAVIVDFDDPATAALVLQHAYTASSGANAITVALLSDQTRVRNAFGAGANFVLYKPVSPENAEASLRAAIALIKRERRRSLRVPVQVPVWLRNQDGPEVEGILLSLSENGMEVLASQPLTPAATIGFRFSLPGGASEIEGKGTVAWANTNGQAGVRFSGVALEIHSGLKKWILSNAQTVPADALEAISHCRLSDLSLGGCYVETQSPFPERTGVVLSLKVASLEVQAEGVVRVMHPGFGMGIEFATRTADQREHVHHFIDFLTSRPESVPELQVVPSTSAGGDKAWVPGTSGGSGHFYDDPLLDLLRSHESLSQDAFLKELKQQRTTAEILS